MFHIVKDYSEKRTAGLVGGSLGGKFEAGPTNTCTRESREKRRAPHFEVKNNDVTRSFLRLIWGAVSSFHLEANLSVSPDLNPTSLATDCLLPPSL